MKSLDTDAMSNGVKEVISHFGIEVLSNANRFQAAIKDFLPGHLLRAEREQLITSIRIGIGEELLKAVNKSVTEQESLIAADALLIKNGFSKSDSDSVLASFASALGWSNVSLVKQQATQQPTKQPQITQQQPIQQQTNQQENNQKQVKQAIQKLTKQPRITQTSLKPPTPVITTGYATALGVGTATLHGTLKNSAGVTVSLKFEIDTNSGFTSSYTKAGTPGSLSGSGSFSTVLTGLSAGTYYYRACYIEGSNAPVCDLQSPPLSFTVLPPPKNPVPIGILLILLVAFILGAVAVFSVPEISMPEISVSDTLEPPGIIATILTDKTNNEISEIFAQFSFSSSDDGGTFFRSDLNRLIANGGDDFIADYSPEDYPRLNRLIKERYTTVKSGQELQIEKEYGKVKGIDYHIFPVTTNFSDDVIFKTMCMKRKLNGSERYVNLRFLPRNENEFRELVHLVQQIDPEPRFLKAVPRDWI